MNKDYLATTAVETLNELGEARQKWVSTTIALVDAKKALALANAEGRKKITELAGGPKALGSNTDLREMALIMGLEGDLGYVKAAFQHGLAFEAEARARQHMHTLKDALDLFKVLLETGA